jgi:hypothetical protein
VESKERFSCCDWEFLEQRLMKEMLNLDEGSVQEELRMASAEMKKPLGIFSEVSLGSRDASQEQLPKLQSICSY